uniref:Uncharacterized protein n=1 Tax=Glossina brevipalpis TaxID=37001 RepID=A0A1A9WUI9_9MUSC
MIFSSKKQNRTGLYFLTKQLCLCLKFILIFLKSCLCLITDHVLQTTSINDFKISNFSYNHAEEYQHQYPNNHLDISHVKSELSEDSESHLQSSKNFPVTNNSSIISWMEYLPIATNSCSSLSNWSDFLAQNLKAFLWGTNTKANQFYGKCSERDLNNQITPPQSPASTILPGLHLPASPLPHITADLMSTFSDFNWKLKSSASFPETLPNGQQYEKMKNLNMSSASLNPLINSKHKANPQNGTDLNTKCKNVKSSVSAVAVVAAATAAAAAGAAGGAANNKSLDQMVNGETTHNYATVPDNKQCLPHYPTAVYHSQSTATSSYNEQFLYVRNFQERDRLIREHQLRHHTVEDQQPLPSICHKNSCVVSSKNNVSPLICNGKLDDGDDGVANFSLSDKIVADKSGGEDDDNDDNSDVNGNGDYEGDIDNTNWNDIFVCHQRNNDVNYANNDDITTIKEKQHFCVRKSVTKTLNSSRHEYMMTTRKPKSSGHVWVDSDKNIKHKRKRKSSKLISKGEYEDGKSII